jgi:hypothetical protein
VLNSGFPLPHGQLDIGERDQRLCLPQPETGALGERQRLPGGRQRVIRGAERAQIGAGLPPRSSMDARVFNASAS